LSPPTSATVTSSLSTTVTSPATVSTVQQERNR
jgi:hypothetical protein